MKLQFTDTFYHTPPCVFTLQTEQWKALIVCLNIDTKLPCEQLMFNFDHLGCMLKYGRTHFFRLWRRHDTHQNKTAWFRRLRKQHIFITSFRMHWGRIKVTWYKLLLYRGGHYSRFDDDALYFEIETRRNVFFLYNFMMFVVVINHFSILFIIKQAYFSMFLSSKSETHV
jgi:hypothetical protein